jgi:hypothetical protein
VALGGGVLEAVQVLGSKGAAACVAHQTTGSGRIKAPGSARLGLGWWRWSEEAWGRGKEGRSWVGFVGEERFNEGGRGGKGAAAGGSRRGRGCFTAASSPLLSTRRLRGRK